MTKNQQLVRYMTNVFIVRFTQRWKKLMTLSKMNCPSLARACPPFVSMSIILPIIDLPPLKAERHNIIVQSKNNQQENNFFVIWSSYATFAFQYINTLYIFYHIAYVCIVFKGLMFHEKDNITTLWDPMDSSQTGSSIPGILQARVLEGCHILLQGIFLSQGSNPGLPHCRQMFYHLSHQGSRSQ